MSAYQQLSSTKYLEAAASAADAAAVAQEHDDTPAPEASTAIHRTAFWERTASWTSLVAGVAVVSAVGVLAFPYLKSFSQRKPTNPIDLMLRFGGASRDQTFEKFIRDTATAEQQDWEELYRKSPAYQLNGPKQWTFDTSPLLK
jgi:anti-sigma-K factor RskA